MRNSNSDDRTETMASNAPRLQPISDQEPTVTCGALDESELTGIRFKSEQDFERGVDQLFSVRQNFLTVGFDVLLVPIKEYERSKQILKSANLSFTKVSVMPTSELTDNQRKALRRELAENGSPRNKSRKDR
jgi:hypothetical protein